MPAGEQNDEDDEDDRNAEIRQDLSEHDFAAPQRSHHQLVKRAGLPLAREGAGHERDGDELENEPDHAGHDVIDEALLGIVKNFAVDRPRFHHRSELLAHFHRQFLGQLEDIFRQRVDRDLAFAELKITERFLHFSLQQIRRVCVASIDIEKEWNRSAIAQAFAPARRNNKSSLDAVTEQIGFVRH